MSPPSLRARQHGRTIGLNRKISPLYRRLQEEGRLRYDAWWLDPAYRYNEVPFRPQRLTPAAVTGGCLAARRRFYGRPSILKRGLDNRSDFFMLRNYLPINLMHRQDVSRRNGYPLGDETWSGRMAGSA